MFGAKGIEHAKERVSLVVGDVMQPFPDTVQKAGVDTLVMKHFLSAFNDKDAVLILKHCSQVLAPQGKVLLLQVKLSTQTIGFCLLCCISKAGLVMGNVPSGVLGLALLSVL